MSRTSTVGTGICRNLPTVAGSEIFGAVDCDAVHTDPDGLVALGVWLVLGLTGKSWIDWIQLAGVELW